MSLLSRMDQVPCLKGVTMQAATRRLLAHREGGRLTDDKLEGRLEPEDIEILEQEIAPTLWYPIESYDRIVALLREVEGGASDDWWVEYGKESASEILAFGPVQALLKGARSFGPRAGIVLIRLSTLYFNFSKWKFQGESLESFQVEVKECEPMSEPCRLIILGFLRHLAKEFVGHSVPIGSERPSSDTIIYRTPI